MRKRMKFFVVVILCILSAAAGVSYAYLTSADDAENRFRTAQVDIRIVEEFDPPDDPRPGDRITKAPRIHSDSDTDCYVRVRVEFTNDAQSVCEPLEIQPGWQLWEDGYYYWDQVLAPGQETGTLFEAVRIRSDIDEEDITAFDVLVYAEAVQAGDESAETAWSRMDR